MNFYRGQLVFWQPGSTKYWGVILRMQRHDAYIVSYTSGHPAPFSSLQPATIEQVVEYYHSQWGEPETKVRHEIEECRRLHGLR